MPTFDHEIELDISASAMWAGLKDQDQIIPKIMPDVISSIEVVEGEGAVAGTTRTVKFGPKVPGGGHVKERIVSFDVGGHCMVTEELEGGHLAQFGFTKWVQTLKLISTGDSSSKLHGTWEYEGGSEEKIDHCKEMTKQGFTNTFTALAQHVKSNINVST